MQATGGAPIQSREDQGTIPRRAWAPLIFILSLTALFALALRPALEAVGPVAAVLITVPVGLAGWYFGTNVGLVASVLGILLSTFLLAQFEAGSWLTWILNGWPGNIMVIAVGYVAGSLHNGFLERTGMVDELRARDRYLTLISMTTRDILNPRLPEDRYYYLVTHLVNLFVGDYAHFIRWDPAKRQAVLTASTVPLARPHADVTLALSESALAQAVLESGRALVLEDLQGSDYSQNLIDRARFTDSLPPAQSILAIPLLARDYKLGAVIIAYNMPRHFTPEEIEYAELAGNHVALALFAIQQEQQIQKQLREAHALAGIERVLSETERVGLEMVLQLIVDSARELIPGAEHAVLHLLDDERQILIPRAVAGTRKGPTSRLSMRVGEGVAGQVIAGGEVIAVADTRTDPRFLNEVSPATFRSLIVAPIQSNERCVGTISIQSDIPAAFTPDESRLLGTLGTQASIAIENANLLETTQQGLKEINSLYHVSQGLAASLDPDQLMGDVANLLQQNFGYYHVQIFVLDTESGELVASQGSGEIGRQHRQQGYRLQAGAGIVGHVAETGKPFVTNAVDQVVFFVRHPLLPGTQSELTVPIKVENQVVGVLDIQQVPPARLTSRDLHLMIGVGDQLAVALQKANLYAELQTSLRQEKATRAQLIQSERLAVVGRLLASVSHELNNPLQAIQNALFLLKEEEKLSMQGRQDLEIVLSETERMSALIDRLRATYRPSATEDFREIKLNGIVEDVRSLTATHMRHKEITFEFLADPELPVVFGIPDQMRQVVLNLFMNAVEAMPPGGHLTIATQASPDQGKVLLSVTDSGPGIKPELLPHIFEPFITSKDTGTGLGLTITYDIIRQHSGDIQAENNPQGGATFKVWLPVKKKD